MPIIVSRCLPVTNYVTKLNGGRKRENDYKRVNEKYGKSGVTNECPSVLGKLCENQMLLFKGSIRGMRVIIFWQPLPNDTHEFYEYSVKIMEKQPTLEEINNLLYLRVLWLKNLLWIDCSRPWATQLDFRYVRGFQTLLKPRLAKSFVLAVASSVTPWCWRVRAKRISKIFRLAKLLLSALCHTDSMTGAFSTIRHFGFLR